jgi:hypothetical protein
MCPGQDSPYGDRAERDGPVVPRPRPTPDDHPENLPDIGADQQIWQDNQTGKRGKQRRVTGHVTRIGGAEGERLRGELATIIRDLLNWAAQQSNDTQSGDDSDDTQHPT